MQEGRISDNTMSFEDMIETLLEKPCWIMDIMPEQVPPDAKGQYFSVEKYYRVPERLEKLHRKYAEILLRLNAYYDMAVSYDACEHWMLNPDPEEFVKNYSPAGIGFYRVLFPSTGTMADLDAQDTWITIYNAEPLLDKLQKLAAAEGLFVWKCRNN